ncbi:FtsQ-type POTRA domain-containing protein [Arthrobacter sp. JZ12]|uniref:cell division protein FtsQ/DivIB n=1 Tax=Arthrobacter sp. JZ12 TaxID=2654190 RepID=UPI002B4704C6|nr:FtsQ-type POTRA domain-containing protein [Arthrobacter sp. JZ12]WRH24732.1 FtsQ-type POTRA domain-containing protein [Arthrobacter sp. JZ12]
MTRRPPRRPGNGSRPTPDAPETISATKLVPARRTHEDPAPETITAHRETPVALLDREQSGTVLAFPEPPGRRRRRWWLIGVVTTVLAVAGLLAFLVLSPALAVRNIEVQGNRLVPEDQVSAALAPLVGQSLTQVGEDGVRALLADFPPVEDVSVAASPPSTLIVTVHERTPVAVLESGGKFILIDPEGRQLSTVAKRESASLPLIDGGTNAVNSAVFSSITDVLASLPAEIRERLVHASASSIDSVELKLTDGKTIFWGSAEQNQAKAKVIAAMLTEKDLPVKVYDVSTPSRPVTR